MSTITIAPHSAQPLTVARLGYGTMQLPGEGVWGPPRDRDAAIAVLRRAVEIGITLFDTADSYGPEVAENLTTELAMVGCEVNDAIRREHGTPPGMRQDTATA